MIERVARAMDPQAFEEDYQKHFFFKSFQEQAQAKVLRQARAAIEAMMEPIPRMKMVSQGVFMNSAKNYTIEGSDWENIIREALK